MTLSALYEQQAAKARDSAAELQAIPAAGRPSHVSNAVLKLLAAAKDLESAADLARAGEEALADLASRQAAARRIA